MIYTMIRGDLLRFCLIFFVFMAGFSQALHVLFIRIECENDFGTVIKTFFRMFCVTLQQIADAYRNFYLHPNYGIQVIGKVCGDISRSSLSLATRKTCRFQVCFVTYIVTAAVLLVNMLIASMFVGCLSTCEARENFCYSDG